MQTEDSTANEAPAEHPLEGGQTEAVDDAQEPNSRAVTYVLVRFPDGAETLEPVADGAYPRRGDEISPGWIVDQVEIRDGRDDDIAVDGEPVYAEVTVVDREEFVA